jgi:hypothetical protein
LSFEHVIIWSVAGRQALHQLSLQILSSVMGEVHEDMLAIVTHSSINGAKFGEPILFTGDSVIFEPLSIVAVAEVKQMAA